MELTDSVSAGFGRGNAPPLQWIIELVLQTTIYITYNLSFLQDKNSQLPHTIPDFSTFSAVTFIPRGHIKRADKKEGRL
jgi:hypothetical protein